jgi:acyl carrier protein
MHDQHDIPERLRQLLCGRLGLAGEDLGPEATLEDIGIDSVELAFIFSYFERDTGLSFDDAEVDVSRYKAVGDIAEVLSAKIAKGANGALGPDV